jgi:hypothetical protein
MDVVRAIVETRLCDQTILNIQHTIFTCASAVCCLFRYRDRLLKLVQHSENKFVMQCCVQSNDTKAQTIFFYKQQCHMSNYFRHFWKG